MEANEDPGTRDPKLADVQGLLDEFRDESDRAAAILGAAYLDECLKELLASFLVDDRNQLEKLLGRDRPLATFSSRIRAAYCMGWISKTELQDLRLMARIRNRFAHDLHGVSFSSGRIKDRCGSLKIPKTLGIELKKPVARKQFALSMAVLGAQLQHRAQEAKQQRRLVHEGFERDLKAD